ncbi:ATP-dependent RNA helicase DbpA [Poseidonibacter ostreae]|uniref:ATP-dependent RNA helicase DbpA n=1 Tax=Poseidonibacter ostreae TaxID=2654171 RepID=A0A6L4WRG1_9BACT|nr:ATP-dependent RNA helicase DbpA [Poseidonibacter ostreae]KAB7887237.1 ATP-dependent RNA helicase DbpA [Poseidonibacter ostreae]KAB7888294.1 ATP-dependent RNA helicase DbpA [Poseidonibacter ostreae]KAB7889508.1 ATP-dependent RNA helicase DbpA [Poseidonibacter ostreae]MAC82902.1 ATP-dependent RNA helicase DbpA [Arcobacter sp.]
MSTNTNSTEKFSNLNLSKDFLSNLDSLGFDKMTEIQEKALPALLEKKDVIAQAKTGSGKTVAFSIPIVHKLDVKRFRIQSIVLAPTRELANQIAIEIRKLSRHIHNVKVLTLCGGVAYRPQVSSLFHGAHIIVGTPGRILKHINEENINLNEVDTLVLDEADKMLDMGFTEDITKIINVLPKNRQSLLFSATYQENIDTLASFVTTNPINVKNENEEKTVIEQKLYEVESSSKTSLIPALISSNKAKSVLIFCNTKIQCDELSNNLYDLGLDVLTLHSDLEQKQRDETIIFFSNKSYPILIATDVASRGLHIDDIDLVINYDIARDLETHTHRIGRTARAGKGGLAISLYNNYEDEDKIEDIKKSFDDVKFERAEYISDDLEYKIDSDYRTLFINGGKKQKVRAGDILGALTAGVGLAKDDIGKINSLDFCSYVAVKKEVVKKALDGLSNGRIKGKYFKIYEK